jgi:glycosyltransferase involved in cell wall biosynthesis
MPSVLMVDLGKVWGGQEIYTGTLAEALMRRGWNVSSVSSQIKHNKYFPKIVPISNSYLSFRATADAISHMQRDYNIIHFNGIRAIYLSNFCRKEVPFIGTKHLPYFSEDPSFSPKKYLAFALSPFVYHKLDWLISISEKTLSELPMAVRERSSVVLNGVVDQLDREIELDEEEIVKICFVGRFVEHKGVIRLLEAMQILKDRMVGDFKLVMAGEGPLEQTARNFVKTTGLESIVEFKGFLEDPKVIYRNSHICVLPSLHEGLPLSLLEALSAGCALVGHQVSGVADVIINEYNGVLSGISSEDLATRLSKLISDRELLATIRRNARVDYEERWRVDRMVDETENLYHKLLT